MSLQQVNFGSGFLCGANMLSSVGVHVDVALFENCKGSVGGGANFRGLIMTPYYSLQELPSLAHHITCMA